MGRSTDGLNREVSAETKKLLNALTHLEKKSVQKPENSQMH